MHLTWTDIQDIAIALDEKYPHTDPQWINFVDLRQSVCALAGFNDEPNRCNERILEAIQAAWLDQKQ